MQYASVLLQSVMQYAICNMHHATCTCRQRPSYVRRTNEEEGQAKQVPCKTKPGLPFSCTRTLSLSLSLCLSVSPAQRVSVFSSPFAASILHLAATPRVGGEITCLLGLLVGNTLRDVNRFQHKPKSCSPANLPFPLPRSTSTLSRRAFVAATRDGIILCSTREKSIQTWF